MIPERPSTIPVPGGITLEAALAMPPAAGAGVVVCHPHPRYGGDMDSPVVLAAVTACAARGLATLRFNFRGVGGSGGAWDEGRGEGDDVRAALGYLRGLLGRPARVGLAGYSFGAAMAASVAAGGEPTAGLALIAPPLASPGWRQPAALASDGPILIVAGGEDTYCPRQALAALARAVPAATVTVIAGADHFFHAGQDELHTALATWAEKIAL
jgi:alpha/beta superfamily hydrolase